MCGEMRARCCAARGRVKDSIFALVASVEGGGKINFLGSDLPVFVAIDSLERVKSLVVKMKRKDAVYTHV